MAESINNSVEWNDSLRLAIADVDETIAGVYEVAEPEMHTELEDLLSEGVKLFMVSGGSLAQIKRRVTDDLDPSVRRNILISHCSGAEVWGFDESGELRDKPFYSVYEETFSEEAKTAWRAVVNQVIDEFGLRTHGVRPKPEFIEAYQDPLDIMIEDRGPQITFEFVNATHLTEEQVAQLPYDVPESAIGTYDLREPVLERTQVLLKEANVPVTPRLAGNFALDLAIEGVSKKSSIEIVMQSQEVLAAIGLQQSDVQDPSNLEIWGDKFSYMRGGTDRHMSEAVSPLV